MKGLLIAAAVLSASSVCVASPAPELPERDLVGAILDPLLGTVTNIVQILANFAADVGDATASSPGAGVPAPPDMDSTACRRSSCCAWTYVTRDMAATFRSADGACNELARQAVRMGFHDAGAWNSTSAFGGADGSIVFNDTEFNRVENKGMQDIRPVYQAWYAKYSAHGVGMADLVQVGAIVATLTCPKGPRIMTLVGRTDNRNANPEGLIPRGNQDATAVCAIMAAKGFSCPATAALVGAHSVSIAQFVPPNAVGKPQDSTPDVWDVNFYGETLDPNATAIGKFPSDVSLSQDPRTSGVWKQFAGKGGQQAWNAVSRHSLSSLFLFFSVPLPPPPPRCWNRSVCTVLRAS